MEVDILISWFYPSLPPSSPPLTSFLFDYLEFHKIEKGKRGGSGNSSFLIRVFWYWQKIAGNLNEDSDR